MDFSNRSYESASKFQIVLYFKHKSKGYLLTTNYKVMACTLTAQSSLSSIGRKSFIGHQVVKKYFPVRLPAYLVVRNPYKRMASFFKDKFRQHPSTLQEDPCFNWQGCQKIFLPYLTKKEELSDNDLKALLLNTSFEKMIHSLPHVFHLDGHLTPQASELRTTIKSIPFAYQYDQYLKIEQPEDLHFLSANLGLDLSMKLNHTSSVQETIHWTNELKAIVQKIYWEDFQTFQYDL